jgi:tetratricopeptide (TPR) repeat protein
MLKVSRLTPEQERGYAAQESEAIRAIERGDPDSAARLLIWVLEQAPGHAGALKLLLQVRRQEGKRKAEEVLLRRLNRLLPNDLGLTCELTLLLYQQGNLAEAEQLARNAVRLGPNHAQSHNLMGMILTDANRLLAAEYHYRKALELHEPVGKLCANMGLNLKRQGKVEEAGHFYREAMRLEPDNVTSLLGWVRLEEARRNWDEAWKLQERAETLAPDNPNVILTRAVLLTRGKRYDEALAELDRIEQRFPDDQLGPAYLYERGRILDKIGAYDRAFEAYERANRSVKDQGKRAYNEPLADSLATRLKGFFTRSRMGLLPQASLREDMPQPLFIVGFPRSGTTMTEQILTSHPHVAAGDELPFIWDLTRIGQRMLNSPLNYPEFLADLWMGDNLEALDNFRDYYLQKARQLGIFREGARQFTDKMPLNETNLGLIHLVFPEAPILHLVRHPLDVVLSTFFIDLTHGFNCSYDLVSAARHYALIFDLLQHYRQELDLNYRAIRYEDIVNEPEPRIREMLEFIGEPWDARCLDFHKNERYARTASYAQVTEKLYTSSRYRYRNYRRQVESVIPILEPAIRAYGYEVD